MIFLIIYLIIGSWIGIAVITREANSIDPFWNDVIFSYFRTPDGGLHKCKLYIIKIRKIVAIVIVFLFVTILWLPIAIYNYICSLFMNKRSKYDEVKEESLN